MREMFMEEFIQLIAARAAYKALVEQIILDKRYNL